MSEQILKLEQITKSFGDTPVLKGIDLEIAHGEFITLLGSSGCGKTTTLRIIAGLETPDAGRVLLNGADVTALPPEKRSVNTVFQNYALFPHMTVEANIGYGLRLRRKSKEEIRKKVAELLQLVQLEGFGGRMPSELSGGQRQRVAIARALAVEPQVLLLDEPLGALDLQLRRQMQFELKRLQKQLGLTFIYITHDQEEALNMSDRIAVMRDGRFEQIGTPGQVYDHPRTAYVARFVGSANILRGTVKQAGDTVCLETPAGCARALAEGHAAAAGQTACLAVRSEHLQFVEEGQEGLAAVIREKTFSGGMLRIILELEGGQSLVASRHGIDMDAQPGQRVRVTWDPRQAVLVEDDEEAGK